MLLLFHFLLFTVSLAIEENLIFVLRGQTPEFVPEAVIDVGANKGKYSAFIRRMFPETSILLLEADAMHEQKLSQFCEGKEGVEYKIAVLSSSVESVPWYGGGDTGNSMFREQSNAYEKDVPATKMTQTLDSIVAQSHIANKRVGIIKVDVQGAELLVLKGGSKALAQATFVQIEASTIKYNEGGACTWQVDEYLRSQGYALYEIGDKRYSLALFKTPGLGQYDLIYINTKNLPERAQNASFCAGISSSSKNGAIFADSVVELENLVGMTSSTASCRKKGSSGIILLVGLVVGYAACLLQNRFFRLRRIQRED
jgi:FkbM family methyltransferase